MKKFTMLGAALVFSLSTVSAFAQWSKIGVVDIKEVLKNTKEMKAIQAELETKFKSRRDKLMGMETDIKKDMEKYKRDATVMSPNQKKTLKEKIMQAQQEFEREGQQYQQELSMEHNKKMESLYNKVRQAINKVAKKQDYDLVVQKEAAPYSLEKLDITGTVIKEVN